MDPTSWGSASSCSLLVAHEVLMKGAFAVLQSAALLVLDGLRSACRSLAYHRRRAGRLAYVLSILWLLEDRCDFWNPSPPF